MLLDSNRLLASLSVQDLSFSSMIASKNDGRRRSLLIALSAPASATSTTLLHMVLSITYFIDGTQRSTQGVAAHYDLAVDLSPPTSCMPLDIYSPPLHQQLLHKEQKSPLLET